MLAKLRSLAYAQAWIALCRMSAGAAAQKWQVITLRATSGQPASRYACARINERAPLPAGPACIWDTHDLSWPCQSYVICRLSWLLCTMLCSWMQLRRASERVLWPPIAIFDSSCLWDHCICWPAGLHLSSRHCTAWPCSPPADSSARHT